MTVLNLQVAAGTDDAHERANGTGFTATDSYLNCRASATVDRGSGGLRFANVTIPQGANIISAVLTVEPIGATVDNAAVDIRAEDVDNAANFSTTPDVISRARTVASVPWTEDDIPVGGTSPNIAAVVQEVVSRAGWVSGNALVIIIDGRLSPDKAFRPASFEHATLNPIKLDITYATIFLMSVGGTMTPAGVSIGLMSPAFAGAAAPAGMHIGLLSKDFAGAITPSALLDFLTPLVSSLVGAITSSGTVGVIRSLQASIGGALTPVGLHVGTFANFFLGVVSSAGELVMQGLFTRAGAITPSGTLAVVRNILLQGLITPLGETLHKILMSFAGAIEPIGALSFLTPAMRIAGRLRAFVTDRDGTPRGHILP